jgi:hypothetical protein
MFDVKKLLEQHKVKNIAELEALLAKEQAHYNDAPQATLSGLSPNQVHSLLYEPFDPESPFGFRPATDTDLDECPFFRLSECILQCTVMRATPFKLTQATSSLPTKVVKEIYDLIRDAFSGLKPRNVDAASPGDKSPGYSKPVFVSVFDAKCAVCKSATPFFVK